MPLYSLTPHAPATAHHHLSAECILPPLFLFLQVLHAQEALERKLAMLDTHQRGIHETLTGMEHEAARLAQEEAGLQDEGTRCEAWEGIL